MIHRGGLSLNELPCSHDGILNPEYENNKPQALWGVFTGQDTLKWERDHTNCFIYIALAQDIHNDIELRSISKTITLTPEPMSPNESLEIRQLIPIREFLVIRYSGKVSQRKWHQ